MRTRELAYCGVFGAAALVLPVFFHLVHLGRVFMPMYLPLVALAFMVRARPAALTALIVPVLSGAATGMPPFYPPIAVVMSVELALMALLIGGVRSRWPGVPVFTVLLLVLVAGRVLSAALSYLAALVLELPPGYVAGISLLSGWPGVVLMLVVIPQLVKLNRGS